MENKKTAVEQVVEFFRSGEYPHLYRSVVDEWIKTFLEKERQQIIDAYNSGDYMATTKERLDYDESEHEYKNAEEYYEKIRNK